MKCEQCWEDISSLAKKCPYCRSPTFWSKDYEQPEGSPAIGLFVLMIPSFWFLGYMLGHSLMSVIAGFILYFVILGKCWGSRTAVTAFVVIFILLSMVIGAGIAVMTIF
jgi:hypothetical protein